MSKVGKQIFYAFHTDRDPNHSWCYTVSLKLSGRHIDVRGIDWNAYQRFHPSEAHRVDGNIETVTDFRGSSHSPFDLDRDDSTKLFHLPFRNLMIWMLWKARVDYSLDFRMFFKLLCELQSVVVLSINA